MGLRIGPAIGLVGGLAGGSGGGSPPALVGVTRDATSLKYCPMTAGEWTTTMTAAAITSGNPLSLWGYQDTATPIADALTTNHMDYISGSPAYQMTVSGWTRKGIGTTVGGATLWYKLGASVGDLDIASGLMLGYVIVTSTGATGDVFALGYSTMYRGVRAVTGPLYRAFPNDASAVATGAVTVTATVKPVILRVNRTAGSFSVITPDEIITQSPYTAPPSAANTGVFFGGAVTNSPTNFSCLYAAAFRGAAAELTDAQVRTLLTTLGWTVTW